MQDNNSPMLLQTIKQVDLIYAIFLGRLPEDNFVRADNLGRPVLELVKAMIRSEEFKQSILERFSLYGRLPHRQLSLRLLPDALELIAEAELAGPHHGASVEDWKSVLGRVLGDVPCRAAIEEAYGAEGRQLIEKLTRLESPATARADEYGAAQQPQLTGPHHGASVEDWQSVLGRVLGDVPCRAAVEEAYGAEGRQLIETLTRLELPAPLQR